MKGVRRRLSWVEHWRGFRCRRVRPWKRFGMDTAANMMDGRQLDGRQPAGLVEDLVVFRVVYHMAPGSI